MTKCPPSLEIAVIGSGIAGLGAAWLLSKNHNITLYEQDDRLGGHANTIVVGNESGQIPVDTGFIVYNTLNYPNLMALFDHLNVPTKPSDMSFAVSLDKGRFEYAGSDLNGLLAQRRNIVRPAFWRMLSDLVRFYRDAPCAIRTDLPLDLTLGKFLKDHNYSSSFIDHHILPMGAAIWSCSKEDMLSYPAMAFIRFFENHGLLRLAGRPEWRTVDGGSREYIRRLMDDFSGTVLCGTKAAKVNRGAQDVTITDSTGQMRRFDHVVLAGHADQSLGLLDDATSDEKSLLGAFRYQTNTAWLHDDPGLMPRRRRAWASWNYLGRAGHADEGMCVTYWMNRLQSIPGKDLFVTLNPADKPRDDSVITCIDYDHPVFDTGAIGAQKNLWRMQGCRNTWFCGAYFGSGFHEDGLQSGLAVAEALGGADRPWLLENPSDRLCLAPHGMMSSSPDYRSAAE